MLESDHQRSRVRRRREAGDQGMRRIARRATRRLWLGVLAACVLSAIRTAPNAQPAPGEDDAVLAADAALGGAMRAGDKSAARRLLSLEFTYIDEDGKLHARKEFLGGLAGLAPAAPSYVAVKIYGLLAMVTGHRKSAQGSDAFFLDIFAKEKRAWRALAMQDVVPAAADASQPGAESAEALHLRSELSKILGCKNCETIPYRVRSPAEQDVVTTFQVVEKAIFDRDVDEYAKHIAGEFVHYESDVPPLPRAGRIAVLEQAKQRKIPAVLPAIQTMRLWVYGDGAAMISAEGVPDEVTPLLRVARIWVRRNGQWQMAISVLTNLK